MRRRDVIAGLGVAALPFSWPPAARAQPAQPVVGLLASLAQQPLSKQVKNVYRGLSDAGFVPGRVIE